jgi:hypothetical protein
MPAADFRMENRKNERVRKIKMIVYAIASFLLIVLLETPRFSQMISDGSGAYVTSNS